MRQRRATGRIYPRDLHSILHGLWDSTPFFDGWPAVELPPKAVLDELLDVCFQASMLTEEGRPTVFRVAYIASGSPVTPSREQLEEPAAGPWKAHCPESTGPCQMPFSRPHKREASFR